MARHVALQLGLTYHELDASFHQPGWTPLAQEEFARRIKEFVQGDAWIIDGNYGHVQHHVFEKAQVIVAFDLARYTVMRRIVKRTIRRVLRSEVLWNENREGIGNLFAWNPEKSVIRWSWTTYHRRAKHIAWLETLAKDRGVRFFRVQKAAPTEQTVNEIFNQMHFAS